MTENYREYMFTSNATDFYCCNPGDVCWTTPSVCAGDGSTFTCSRGSNTWCCLKDQEICTQLSGQINICYSSAKNPLQNTSATLLNQTYSSLSAAQPSASYYSFDPAVVISQTVPTPTQPTPATSSSALSSEKPSSNQISGGAIAGIVIGVVAVIAIAGLAAVLFLRSKKKKISLSEKSTMSRNDRRPVEEIRTYPDNTPQEMQANPIKPVELPDRRMQ
ncbi:hypothetical protein FB567DRAFT_545640 [Paraphoma chrysanthemicola]|uniref:Uncharacterized protein n=1 Tax=Paraphoma chrysanthemicola TaxID=798071 RepID=A0A8K0W2Y1_9PLEO|nr:hypothetical protein FB567DRAFT_545640 [Paraphoma chrysanthemicola]